MRTTFPRILLPGVVAFGLLAGCAAIDKADIARHVDRLMPADAILIGEQHDAAEHQQLARAFVEQLADRGQLGALVVEMAERGTSTAGLPADATEEAVQAALRWNEAGWPWRRYRPVVMAAVVRGVPVLGGNLARSAMRDVMAHESWDRHLAAAALARQQAAIRTGHCDLLPATQIQPMVRIQLARDAAMAAVVADAAQAGKTVLLVAGKGHVYRALGVPTHLARGLRVRTVVAVAGEDKADDTADLAGADLVWRTAATPPRDHCADLARTLQKG